MLRSHFIFPSQGLSCVVPGTVDDFVKVFPFNRVAGPMRTAEMKRQRFFRTSDRVAIKEDIEVAYEIFPSRKLHLLERQHLRINIF